MKANIIAEDTTTFNYLVFMENTLKTITDETMVKEEYLACWIEKE